MCTFGTVRRRTRFFTFLTWDVCSDLVPTLVKKGGSRFGRFFQNSLRFCRTCIMPGIWPQTRSESQLQAFHRTIALLGVVTALGKQVPYVLRRAGASAGAWAQRRSLTEIQVRGRWRSAGSVRRYDKGGRVANQMSACSEPLQRFARLCVAAIPRRLGVERLLPRAL